MHYIFFHQSFFCLYIYFLSWKKTLCVAFLHLIYQLLNHYPAISPQWSPIIHPASLLQPQGQNAYENHYENNVSLCLRNVAYMFGASFFVFLLCGCVCAAFCWGQYGERKIAWRTLDVHVSLSLFSMFFIILERQWSVPIKAARWELDGERLRLPGHNVLSVSLCLWLNFSKKNTEVKCTLWKWAIPPRPIPVFVWIAGLCVLRPVVF